jgi:hypothetical protein
VIPGPDALTFDWLKFAVPESSTAGLPGPPAVPISMLSKFTVAIEATEKTDA